MGEERRLVAVLVGIAFSDLTKKCECSRWT
jgi:hypothetical protein